MALVPRRRLDGRLSREGREGGMEDGAMILAFEVYGVPQPKGSTRSFGYLTLDASGEQVIRTKTIGDNSKNGTWQRDVGFTALAAMTRSDPRFRRINDGAVSVSVDF